MVRTWRIAKWTAPNGTTYEYEYIDLWGKRYRSFDSGLTQHTSKSEALRLAIEAGNRLTVVVSPLQHPCMIREGAAWRELGVKSSD